MEWRKYEPLSGWSADEALATLSGLDQRLNELRAKESGEGLTETEIHERTLAAHNREVVEENLHKKVA